VLKLLEKGVDIEVDMDKLILKEHCNDYTDNTLLVFDLPRGATLFKFLSPYFIYGTSFDGYYRMFRFKDTIEYNSYKKKVANSLSDRLFFMGYRYKI
jgi:hypothetical protein